MVLRYIEEAGNRAKTASGPRVENWSGSGRKKKSSALIISSSFNSSPLRAALAWRSLVPAIGISNSNARFLSRCAMCGGKPSAALSSGVQACSPSFTMERVGKAEQSLRCGCSFSNSTRSQKKDGIADGKGLDGKKKANPTFAVCVSRKGIERKILSSDPVPTGIPLTRRRYFPHRPPEGHCFPLLCGTSDPPFRSEASVAIRFLIKTLNHPLSLL